nr:hypothetical protein Itr_chr09CG13320 [Ipomoea trifida]
MQRLEHQKKDTTTNQTDQGENKTKSRTGGLPRPDPLRAASRRAETPVATPVVAAFGGCRNTDGGVRRNERRLNDQACAGKPTAPADPDDEGEN